MDYHTSTGKIIYDPKRPGLAKNAAWWCILTADREITRYYRWWIERELWGRTAVIPGWLCNPSWDAHVSIVRGERPRDPSLRKLWKKHHGKVLSFQYAHYPRQAGDTTGNTEEKGNFYFVDVVCPELTEIREELGLKTFYKFHLTIGRVWEDRLQRLAPR